MLIKNNESVLADFELSLDTDSLVQLDMYSEGFQRIKMFYLDSDKRLGDRIRPGVVRVNPEIYDSFEDNVKKDLFNNTDYQLHIISKGKNYLNKLEKTLNDLFAMPISNLSYSIIKKLLEDLSNVLSMVSFNWVIPTSEIQSRFKELLGEDIGNNVYLNCNIPNQLPHFSLLNLELFRLALKKLNNEKIDYEHFKDYYGCLLSFGGQKSSLEINEGIDEEVNSILTDCCHSYEEIEKKISFLIKNKSLAIQRKNKSFYTLFQLFKEKDFDPDMIMGCISNALLIEFVNEEEEARHILQMRAQRILDKLISFLGLQVQNITIKDLLAYLKEKDNAKQCTES